MGYNRQRNIVYHIKPTDDIAKSDGEKSFNVPSPRLDTKYDKRDV